MVQQSFGQGKIGLAFPLRFEGGGGADGAATARLGACSYEGHIKQSIRVLLFTAIGTRVMRPDFGSRAGDFVFENITATTATLIRHEVRSSIERFEPRVELNDVIVSADRRNPGTLIVEVNYRILETDADDSLSLVMGD